jgi:hypothetical protein
MASAVGAAEQPAKVGTPGPTVKGVTYNSPAALASPNCDAATKEIKIVLLTRPPCVEPWKGGDNGGATSRGVTAGAVKVVMYLPTDAYMKQINAQGVPVNRATGQTGLYEDSIKDMLPVFLHQGWETYGRQIDVDYVTMSGTDEAAQRADAVDVIARKPFFVADLVGAPAFASQVAAAKIIVQSSTGTNADAAKQAPYRWLGADDPEGGPTNAGEFAKQALVGKPARYGGDDVKSKTRKFGVLYQTDGIDVSSFLDQLPKGSYVTGQYTLPVDSSQAATAMQQQAPTLLTKMKSEGVTTMVVFGPFTAMGPVLSAATQQQFTPEWFVPGSLAFDVAIVDRTFDQSQWKHAFGLGQVFPPVVGGTLNQNTAYFNWYWGPNQGTYGAFGLSAWMTLFRGLMSAGPKLTPKTFQQGIFSLPAVGGAATGSTQSYLTGYGHAAGTSYDEYASLGYDFHLWWWDADAVGISSGAPVSGTGRTGYLHDGHRFAAGSWPKGDQPFFDKSKTMYEEVATGPAGPGQAVLGAADQLPNYPCTGCPSSTSAGGG